MTHEVRVSARAADDIESLATFLAAQSPSAATKAIDLVEGAITSLGQMPNRGLAGPRGTYRELRVKFGRSAFVLRYQTRADRILVTRVYSSQQPQPR